MVKNEYKYEICIDDVEQFNESIVTKEFLDSCKMAAKLFEKPKTNADRIRSMTDEELANSVYIPCPYDDGGYRECKFGWHEQKQTCEECKLEWLRMTTKD